MALSKNNYLNTTLLISIILYFQKCISANETGKYATHYKFIMIKIFKEGFFYNFADF